MRPIDGRAHGAAERQEIDRVTSVGPDGLVIPDPALDAEIRAGIASVEALLRAQGPRGLLAPIVDGRTLPQRPISATREGVARAIPLLVGYNRDEEKLYAPPTRPALDDAKLEKLVQAQLPRNAASRAADVIAVYRKSRQDHGLPHSLHDIADAIGTASRFRIPATRLCEAQQAHQPRTFLYQFDWESPARRGALGACHGLEIPFVFGTIGASGDTRFTGEGPEADHLSHQMMDAWLAFARSGEPRRTRSRRGSSTCSTSSPMA